MCKERVNRIKKARKIRGAKNKGLANEQKLFHWNTQICMEKSKECCEKATKSFFLNPPDFFFLVTTYSGLLLVTLKKFEFKDSQLNSSLRFATISWLAFLLSSRWRFHHTLRIIYARKIRYFVIRISNVNCIIILWCFSFVRLDAVHWRLTHESSVWKCYWKFIRNSQWNRGYVKVFRVSFRSNFIQTSSTTFPTRKKLRCHHQSFILIEMSSSPLSLLFLRSRFCCCGDSAASLYATLSAHIVTTKLHNKFLFIVMICFSLVVPIAASTHYQELFKILKCTILLFPFFV